MTGAQKTPRGARRYVYQSRIMRFAAGCFDLAGFLTVRLLTLGRGLRPDSAVMADPKKILVLRLDHIGDVLFSRPALAALRRKYPGARITLLTSGAGACLLAHEKTVDEIIAWDAPWFRRGDGSKPTETCLHIIGKLRRAQYDLSLDLRGDLRHHIMLFLAGVRVRVGYAVTGGGFLLQRTCRLPMRRHEVERNLHLVGLLGDIEQPNRYTPIMLDRGAAESAASWWQGGKPKVVVHPAAGDRAKQWPSANFSALCDALAEQGCEVVLVGTREEQSVTHAVAMACRRPVQDLAGKTGLMQLAALAASADLFIGNDSGPAHLAITQGCPTVILWSETNAPEEWGPWGEGVQAGVVRRSTAEKEIEDALKASERFLQEKALRKD